MAGVKFPKLEVRREGGVRGMYATKKIDRGEVIVSVPPSLLFSYETAGGALKDVWKRTKDMQELDRLTLLLLYFSSKVRSRWDFFLCGIPGMNELGPAVLWSPKKLNETCEREEYSSLCSFVENRRSMYKRLWRTEVAPLPRKFPHIFSQQDTGYSNYLWAIAAVLSRMWLMRRFEEPEFYPNGTWIGPAKWVMAPVAELLNHKPRAGHIRWGSQRRPHLEVVSDVSYRPGEQVFVSYGNKCNLELLLEYGFEIPGNPTKCADEIRAGRGGGGMLGRASIGGAAMGKQYWRSEERREGAERREIGGVEYIAGSRLGPGRSGNRTARARQQTSRASAGGGAGGGAWSQLRLGRRVGVAEETLICGNG
ncbi:hypothetical protein GUITHDRAFT_134587 [Guillardia theta CCMP2712]|uniref:SET domain-containing protein n=1 Tax=Guillardia theta (strain CCMP2712) TaxID=905079 RepID=L1JRH0_GUITC|nr:hypothetical protein GUITHDRAFT_134587 [Guillardia theta CCMP2712]EKX51052.1 hypothetical protein GUITHDRAFT_134587 [Guillardia theta CCMP2712]|eukprot:XP_005838032.1 hypothetical protein GUITHDRAFT_134587 [Guillardia theta CCMP2712]